MHNPLYEQVSDLLKEMISDGRLSQGDKVPSLRKMSRQLKVSIATITKAYMNLEDRGILEVKPQSGYYVRKNLQAEPSTPDWTPPGDQPLAVQSDKVLENIFTTVSDPDFVSLGAAIPSAELLPTKALARTARQIISRDPASIVNYCFAPGLLDLRRQIAYRALDAGCQISPDAVQIMPGGIEAISLAITTVTQPGDIVLVESPTYFGLLQAIEAHGLLALEIDTHPETGLNLDAVEVAINQTKIKAVLTIPNFSNPTGSLMPDANKKRLVEMLAEKQIPLIEDDIFGDLYFGNERPPLCKKYDQQGLVLSCSSFSKTLAPGFRVGWILPGKYADSALETTCSHNKMAASITQITTSEFLRNGHYDRHLEKLRIAYRNQLEQMRMEVAESFPEGTRISRPQGGFILWIQLPNNINAREMAALALQQGVSLTPGDLFSASRRYPDFIRLCAGEPMSARVSQAIEKLGKIANDLCR